ncbi:DUF1127 domain-containing protein [Mesorhizobium sp. CN2-181]|uniref:DUF1127 domain-containing protein n=1 Tax=Mesorhizobium yinganensis TaxID=3157707 RepID=UPI0032B7CBBD
MFDAAHNGLSGLRRLWRNRQARIRLMAMPDDMLKDIGLARSEIGSAVSGRGNVYKQSA